jgi:ABC-2 type transport system ATP-binding protein
MPKEYKERVTELAKIVGIENALFRSVKKLSGGMQRKLEIVRSLIHTPTVLFLDEPTQGLDAVSRRDLWDYINKVRTEYGTTVFLTTHYLDEAEKTDTVCIIDKGKIIACESPDKLKLKSKLKNPTLEDVYVKMIKGGQDEKEIQILS